MKARTAVAGVVVLALAGGGIAIAAQNRPRPVVYTTAVAVTGSITETLTTSGVVDRPGEQSLGFDASGLVTALSVRVGDRVRAGQTLATVDPAPLQVSLLQAHAQLAQARAILDADQAALDSGGTAAAIPGMTLPGGTAGAVPAGLPTGGQPGGSAPGSSAPAGLPAGAATTPAYVTALESSLTKLQGTVEAQQAACAPVYAVVGQLEALQQQLPADLPTKLPTALPTALPSKLPTALPTHHRTPTPSATPSEAPSATPSEEVAGEGVPNEGVAGEQAGAAETEANDPSPAPDSPAEPTTPEPVTLPSLSAERVKELAGQLKDCTQAMVALAGAEQEAGQAILTASAGMQQATLAAQAQLATAQAQLTAAAEAAAREAAAKAMADAQAQLAAQAQRALGSRVTDATIVADRARVLQAEQAVARAERALAGATLTAPADGTVGQVGLVAGESSTGRTITVVGPGAAEVRVEVPLSARGLVTTGLSASVGLVGADPGLTGQVTAVSVLPTSPTGTPTYTATVLVDDPGLTLPPGAKAQVSVPLRSVTDVVTVPLSAVTKTSDTTATVKVVTDEFAEAAETVRVTTGAHGGGRIEITSGLQVGQRVALADRRLPVPGGLAQYQPATPTPTPTPTPTRT